MDMDHVNPKLTSGIPSPSQPITKPSNENAKNMIHPTDSTDSLRCNDLKDYIEPSLKIETNKNLSFSKVELDTNILESCTPSNLPTNVSNSSIDCKNGVSALTHNSVAVTDHPLEALNEWDSFASSPFSTDNINQKRKNEMEDEESPETKKSSNTLSDEKKIINVRKNIRDVMDENQLDTNTLVAQREESERLARVAEQQKVIREYQRQTAVNRQFVRTQNRVLSLLQSGNTFAKIAEVTEESQFNYTDQNFYEASPNNNLSTANICSNDKTLSEDSKVDLKLKPKEATSVVSNEQQATTDIVTIEDSSSEDDCILLSDEEEDIEEETEDDPHNSGLHVKDAYNVPDELGRVVVNIGHPEGEEDIFIAPQIAKTIKPHQIGGVRFLFDNIIESTKRFKSSSGFGCILAHSMGLGKTLQVVCFCDIFLRHTLSKTVLCVMPINTLQNWMSEFNMWIPKVSQASETVRPRQFDIFVLNDQQKTLSARAKVVFKWAEEGGVLLIGYELFRLLALKLVPTRKRRNNKNIHSEVGGTESNKRLMESIHQALVRPGPDLVICDEGHRIKNAHAGISLALKQIRTRRRIVLTGYPLQNNLLEYWCMVDFVRPNYLGTRTEFCNMFERPIQNGQCIDSTPEDIKLMRYRAHVLHSLLVGFVQRRSHVVLQQTLPQKLEYVILTRMTQFQRQLYETFMNDVVRSKTVPNPLKAFAVCCKIWNHPDVLYNFLKKRETDLDLEIDDGEVVAELSSSTSITDVTAAKNKNNPPNLSSNSDLQCNKVKEESITQKLPEEISLNSTNTDLFASHNQESSEKCSLPRSYEDMYFSENYYQQNNDISYSSDCNSSTYWQDPNASYFAPSNMGFSSKPDYVGIVVKQTCQQLKNEENITNSSEIVDLDTKEIKTVETDIDMDRNPIIKNEALNQKPNAIQNRDFSNSTETLADVKFGTNTVAQPQDSKMSNNGPITIIEKEPQKVKGDDGIPYEWAIELMKKYEPDLISNSPKMEIFFCILNESIQLGDRVLLFSQSLLTLNLIEKFLNLNFLPESDTYWARNVSYFRLDGSTTSQEREKLVNEFNSNINVKLFLISTRAGSLGINLVGANRVIVFDASWNPCHDTQAVYRIYRYGQNKPCYVYRIVMDKCLEKKIYDRQIKKQGMSDRVVDECNPDAHLSMKDVTNLCHDYDDEDRNKSESVTFIQPLNSYLDIIVQKIIEQYKNNLSKEPFHHESLLIDRKEKKLSQAEKRQAHRGYEMEKKASIKQTIACSTNKVQYRIVRNDGTVITRPVASIRPMQTTKTQNVVKTGGIRSTRWIPAEVWQRQGMTAQEMTLPLDVVIPTNSNDKSNIILKAGQRVMVLKSAKGIYMQLDSGKIIAIRTSSKATETSKVDKGEVIDITSEGDNIGDAKPKVGLPKINENTSTYSNSGDKNDIKSQNFNHLKGDSKESSEKFYTNENTISKENSASQQKLKNINEQTNVSHVAKSVISNTEDTNIDKLNRNKIPPLQNLKKCSSSLIIKGKNDAKTSFGPFVKKKSVQSSVKIINPLQHTVTLPTSENIQNSSQHLSQMHTTERFHKQQSLVQRLDKDLKKSIQDVPHNLNIKNKSFAAENTKISTEDDGISDLKTSKTAKPDHLVAVVKRNHPVPNIYAQPVDKLCAEPCKGEESKYSAAALLKDEIKTSTENFKNSFSTNSKIGNENKVQAEVRSKTTEYLPAFPSPQVLTNLSEPQISQHSFFQPQQQHSKLHVYVPPHYNLQHTQFNNSANASNTNMHQSISPENNISTNAFFSSREAHNYSQYYDNMYDSNSMPTSCEYPTQFAEYSGYGPYNHQHYHSSHYHPNTYGSVSSTPITSNPYNMHWPPLVTSTPIGEQCNTMYPSSCSQNGTQSNQWHHQ